MVEEEAAEVVAAEAAAEIEEETAVVSPAPADRRLGGRHRVSCCIGRATTRDQGDQSSREGECSTQVKAGTGKPRR